MIIPTKEEPGGAHLEKGDTVIWSDEGTPRSEIYTGFHYNDTTIFVNSTGKKNEKALEIKISQVIRVKKA